MEIKKIKNNTLFSMFLKQLLKLAAYIFLEIIVFIILFWIGFTTGNILPANYSSNYLEQNKDILSRSEPFDQTLIPHTCTYGLFDYDGNYLSGNFSKVIIDDAKAYIKEPRSVCRRFFLVERENGYCVVHFDISAHFSSYTLHKICPDLELMILVLFVLIFFMIVIYTAYSFGKKLKKELQPVLFEIEQIQKKEIYMEQKSSKIKEFNDILLSLYDMKIALSQSLKNEWETEQKRKSNISALAHDIKTPLTIIKGNAELIMEEENISEIYQFADIIKNSTDKIERYINLLIEETKYNLPDYSEEIVSINTIINDIIEESEALCRSKEIELIISNTASDVDVEINANKDLIERAVINLVKNAVEHTDRDKIIKLYFEDIDKKLIVKIEDFGKGFSREALKYAKHQFYTEKSDRGEEHYGIGMYLANNVAERYHGSIAYYNKPDHTGSVVTFEIMYE